MNNSCVPMVSIGIPTYNQPEFLRQAIQSVLNQTFQDFEVIVVDDCSTDNTPDVVRQFGDSRIRYHRTDANLRPPMSWNVCARLATGKYFSVLPHDDVWLPSFLEVMVDIMRCNQDIGFVQCNFYGVTSNLSINQAGSKLTEVRSLKGIKAVNWQLQSLRCNPAAILFNLDKMKNIGFWREDYWDDWAFIIRLAYSYGFYYCPNCLSVVRSHGNNLCKVLENEGRPGGFYVLDQLFDIFGHVLPHSTESLAIYSNNIRQLSVSLFYTAIKLILKGEKSSGYQAYYYSRKINPRIPLDSEIISRLFRRILSRLNVSGLRSRTTDDSGSKATQDYLRNIFHGNHSSICNKG